MPLRDRLKLTPAVVRICLARTDGSDHLRDRVRSPRAARRVDPPPVANASRTNADPPPTPVPLDRRPGPSPRGGDRPAAPSPTGGFGSCATRSWSSGPVEPPPGGFRPARIAQAGHTAARCVARCTATRRRRRSAGGALATAAQRARRRFPEAASHHHPPRIRPHAHDDLAQQYPVHGHSQPGGPR